MILRKTFPLFAALLLGTALQAQPYNNSPEVKAEKSSQSVLDIIYKVNRYWQSTHPQPGWAFWDVAAYHTGNMEVYSLTRDTAFRKYSEDWAAHNQWMGAKSNNRADWKHTYGERDEYVLFGDWQICFQTYLDLYHLKPEEQKIARAKEVMEYQMSTARNDYWWWADGLYMVMPVMTKLYNTTGNPLYLEKMQAYFQHANSIMYDEEAGLYYRDAKYVYPKHKSANGKKDFWARGDGWVFAALAKVIKGLPTTAPNRSFYVQRFRRMAQAIKAAQQTEGYWTRSMLDSAHAPGPESSGTAFFTYGLLWGMNNGILDPKDYLPTAQVAWNYLTQTALQPDGKIGYVQPIGERAIPGQVVDKNSTSPFGVGAFLLAACEMHKWQSNGLNNDRDGYRLVWSDEFNDNGSPDTTKWGYEKGFVRNEEWQWYQPENAVCRDGHLVIEARREQKPNPGYTKGSRDWRRKRSTIDYTAACLLTRGKGSWLYGRFEMRGRISIKEGIWPAWWTLGNDKPWPGNGEIDIMEYYRGKLLANIACLGPDRKAEWFSNTFAIDSLGGEKWASQFHVWRMDWTADYIALFVDDVLLNKVPLDKLNNKDGSGFNPFRQPHYMLLNLAIGGMNGGDASKTSFPQQFEVDYVRVYQKE